ncbi:MAG: hypothetical protein HUU29_11560 [Planctomycetaceae bacterium]|nr:hypothetical protein [Planctomycetaceae bacterium]
MAAAATAGSSVTELLPTQNLRPASACISDLDGRFELRGLGPGEYLIVARQEYQLAESFVTIESNEAPDRVDLVFAAPGALRIHVLDTRTLPLSGVGVYLARCDGADISGISGTSDHNGMIEIDGLSPGEYVVKPTAAGVLDGVINSPHRVIVAAGRNAEFEIVLPALVELHLLVLVDGVPLATESVSLRHGTSASQKGRTDETGAANFKGVIPGAVRLTYEKAGKKWEASLDIPNDPLQSLNADLQPMD